MADIQSKLEEIKKMIDKGEYFTINRARQYGKTTILRALGRFLEKEYLVVSLDFQMMSHANFKNEQTFIAAFSTELLDCTLDLPQEIRKKLVMYAEGSEKNATLFTFFKLLSKWCAHSSKPIVLIIDEVDSATNNQVFLDFLAQLRGYYINRDRKPAFHSVILAGVYDIILQGEEQLSNYLDHYHLKNGYMLTFNFNKTKEVGVKDVQFKGKLLTEAFV